MSKKNKRWFTVCESYISYRPHEVLAYDFDDAIDQVVAWREKQTRRKTPGTKNWNTETKEGFVYGRFEWFVNNGKKKWIRDPISPKQVYLDYKNPLYRV